MQSSNRGENVRSCMISNEENQVIFRLLGHNCQSLSTSVIELYETTPPNHKVWVRRYVGVLCFVKDNNRKNYFFRLYCIIKNKMLWEQEMYNKMEYLMPASFMHTFEGDNCIIAFNFSNEDEAKHMNEWVTSRIAARTRREAKRQRGQAVQKHQNHIEPTNTIENAVPLPMKLSQTQRRKRNLTKADIGAPQGFKHLTHIGWDKNTGMEFRTEDSTFSELISKAGISENQMQDHETRNFIYDFINKHDTNRIIKDEQVVKARRAPPAIPTAVNNQSNSLAAVPPPPSATAGPPGPPVPPRSGSKPTSNRAAPPPPPSVTQVSHEHNNHNHGNNVRNNAPPPRPPPAGPRIPNTMKAPIPPPPPANAPAPPPAPPPLTPVSPPPPPMLPPSVQDGCQADGRSALLESIRSGTTLRPVGQNVENQDRPSGGGDARGDLLSEIRKGFQLKPCNEREVKPISPAAEQQHNGVNDLAAALSRALAERNRVIHPDDDDDDDSSDSNDDWDD